MNADTIQYLETTARSFAERLSRRAPHLLPQVRRQHGAWWISLVGRAGVVIVDSDGKVDLRLVGTGAWRVVQETVDDMGLSRADQTDQATG